MLLAIGVGLTLYVLLGGADFGGGRVGPTGARASAERERSLISSAIGPVWEANHVWLIFVVTILFAAFPIAFAALSVALYVPFGIAIAGIVMRGAAFAFRTYGEPDTGWQRVWTRVFGIASLVTPFVLGMCAAAIASGRIRISDGIVHADLVGVWTGPLSWVAGFLSLAMCAYLAAVYLTVEAVQRGDPGARAAIQAAGVGRRPDRPARSRPSVCSSCRADAAVLWNGMRRATAGRSSSRRRSPERSRWARPPGEGARRARRPRRSRWRP